jgi:ATP-dependent protease HslVU (ClpYQ) peptidase subunit
MEFEHLSAEDVARRAMRIASDMCVYTNDCYQIQIIDCEAEKESNKK